MGFAIQLPSQVPLEASRGVAASIRLNYQFQNTSMSASNYDIYMILCFLGFIVSLHS